MDAGSGQLRFRAAEPGEYELTVIARDDGTPRREARETITITAAKPPPPAPVARRDPPPPPRPRFEDAKFAYVTAITEVDGRRQLWLTIRDSGKLLKLQEGEQFEVAKFQASVRRIGVTEVEVAAGGEARKFGLGENLSQGEQLPRDESSAEEPGDGTEGGERAD